MNRDIISSMLEQEEERNLNDLEFTGPDEALTDEDIDCMLTSFGNHEGKALTIIAMEYETRYSQESLHHRLLKLQGEPPAWKINKGSLGDWCRSSLLPYGVVNSSIDNESERHSKYELTKFGEFVAKPFAALLLNWSLGHPELSLKQVFGHSQPGKSTKTDALSNPATRYRILKNMYLLESPTQNKIIAKSLEKDTASTGQQLTNMADDTILNYSSIDPSDSHVRYTFNPGSNEIIIPANPDIGGKLPAAIRSLLGKYPEREWTREELAKALIVEGRSDSPTLRSNISKILSLYKKAGVVNTGKFDFGIYSSAEMSEPIEEGITELLSMIELFKHRDIEITALGNKLVQDITSSQEAVFTLMEKIYRTSPYANALPSTETIHRIIELAQLHPDSNTREIQIEYRRLYGKLGMHQIRQILNIASSENRLIRTDVGTNSYWNIA